MKKITKDVGGKPLEVTTETTQEFEGSVVITDPCYFFPENVWTALCDCWFDSTQSSTPFTDAGTIYYEGTKVLYSSTAFGDGGYRVSQASYGEITQSDFGVDAGMMAVITLADYEKLTDETPDKGLYAIVEDFSGEVTADGHGNFEGDITVLTDDSDQVTDDWSEDDEEDAFNPDEDEEDEWN
jgi:hypothetical protein